MRLITLVGIMLAVLVAARADGPPGPTPPHAHPFGGEWISKGLRNAAGEWCCGEGDCEMVDDVRAVAAGYQINMEIITSTAMDGHRTRTKVRINEIIPYSEAMPSQDEKFWRCQRPDGSRRCFFAPPPAT